MRRLLLLLLLILLTAAPVEAQSPVTAEVDRDHLSLGDLLTLTVTVRGAGLGASAPDLPPLDDFDMVGFSTSTQVSVVNGRMSVEAAYLYRLRPLRSGELTIPSIPVTLKGQTYTTDPITVQVEGGNAPPAGETPTPQAAPAPDTLAGQDFFVEAEVDNANPYLGQQVVYTFRFYQAVNLLTQPRYDGPSFTGFWNRPQPDQTQYTTRAAGRTYRVTELHTLLFPTAAGEQTIEPATLTIPGGFFSPDEILRTKPVVVRVRPLPPGAPPDFGGAVGQFTIAAEADRTRGKVNDPITLRVTLSGTGNIETLPDPVWPELPGWRAFESKATTNAGVQNGRLSGHRIYERLMVPGEAGDFTLPSISYTYFDPQTETYQTIATDPIPVTIAPADAEPPLPALPGSNKETVQRLASDIRHIKPVPPLLEAAPPPLTGRPLYWLAWGVPLLLLGGNALWLRRQAHRRRHSALYRSLQAAKKARNALARARAEGTDPYAAAGRILTAYLSDKLDRPTAGLTHTDLHRLLQGANVTTPLIQQVQKVLAESDMGRFSPAAGNPAHAQRLLKETEQLIGELEKELPLPPSPQDREA